MSARQNVDGPHAWHHRRISSAGCSKRPFSKAAASEEARRTLRYVEPLSDARTTLADFFSILPMELCRSVYHDNPAMWVSLRDL